MSPPAPRARAVPRSAALLLGLAALLVLLKLALGLLGGRAATSVLSGTNAGPPDQALLGALYAASHFASVLLAPPLALAALLRVLLERRFPPPAREEGSRTGNRNEE